MIVSMNDASRLGMDRSEIRSRLIGNQVDMSGWIIPPTNNPESTKSYMTFESYRDLQTGINIEKALWINP